MVCGLFDVTTVQVKYKAVASKLVRQVVYPLFLEHWKSIIGNDTQSQPVLLQVQEMDAVGKAKVRHVGGWVVRKLLSKYRRYVRSNIYTQNSTTLQSVVAHNKKRQLVDNNLVVQYSQLQLHFFTI